MKPLIGTDLKRFIRDHKRAHPPQRQLAAVLQSVAYPANVGSAFRIADGVSLEKLLLTGITPTPPNATIDRVGRAKAHKVPWVYEEDAVVAVEGLKQEGYHVVALELADTAVPYMDYVFPEKTAVVVGHEDHGVTKKTLAACDGSVFIPMFGKGLSLNVHVSLAVLLFHLRNE